MEWIGYLGLVALGICWIPQSLETVRKGRCDVNLSFLILTTIGGISLMIYALGAGIVIFSILNGITSTGAILNLFYKLFPRSSTPS